jgi:hypothetical protein
MKLPSNYNRMQPILDLIPAPLRNYFKEKSKIQKKKHIETQNIQH